MRANREFLPELSKQIPFKPDSLASFLLLSPPYDSLSLVSSRQPPSRLSRNRDDRYGQSLERIKTIPQPRRCAGQAHDHRTRDDRSRRGIGLLRLRSLSSDLD